MPKMQKKNPGDCSLNLLQAQTLQNEAARSYNPVAKLKKKKKKDANREKQHCGPEEYFSVRISSKNIKQN